ncbi:DNA polymerase III alpha subunit [Candidatus Liberibacter americanus str. Sao Paulo]|uniref:DNA polymerase III subunit alpha n=1 Tax=Candidatus Liberibacter americanus str. Sao Paulo TaxID=1261131 RepID=U6B4A6_9HYPH|nr:DNA polymerase III alpha subunit [Candidatus Liberibacter americanus str. Sao Paulo]
MDRQGDQSPGFVHLRVHSSYSLLEGAIHLKDIIKKAIEDQQPTIAITDTNNLFGALEFSQEAIYAGIQPIIGCQLDIDMQDSFKISNQSQSTSSRQSIVLLAANDKGYSSLIDLVSRMYLLDNGPKSVCIYLSWLKEMETDGLIMLTGAANGPIDRAVYADNYKMAESRLLFLKKIFGNRLYVELQRHEGYNRYIESQIIKLAYDNELPLVATNNSFFLSKEDYVAHDVLMAISHSTFVSQEDRPRVTNDHYLKSRSEMISMFSDLPEALENTLEIAKRCSFLLKVQNPILPHFIIEKCEDIDKKEVYDLRLKSKEGLENRLNHGYLAPGYCKKDYIERLDFELDVIERMNFAGYFLIVADFIQWAKSQNIPVGPGRGSGAGSVTAYALSITDIDPLRFSLLFERFLNPDRVSMPDFDIDFCQDRRDEVIKYVQNKYGYERVAQIITFGSLQAKGALRDVGRALQMSYSQVERICKLVPNNPAHPISLRQTIADDKRFQTAIQQAIEDDPLVDHLIDIAVKLEGLYRHTSTHAAGIVIGDRSLSKLVPMYRDTRSDMPITQFNMKWIEKAGLVKFDFLGLKTLTVLQKSIDLLANKGKKIDLSTITFNDDEVYDSLKEKGTLGIFQLESSGMRQALEGMNADRIEDIIALVSLYRPGPIDNIAVYNRRKKGEEKIAYIHPLIDPILKETQGVIIYQEQVMQIAKLLAGYSLSEADILRRAMGKKIEKEMNKQRTRFVDGAKEKGLTNKEAVDIFELLAKFANYGFNKSHATAYAVISYQTAWMKTFYTAEFLAASMTLDMDNTDRIKKFFLEAKKFNIEVIIPDINTSCVDFEVKNNKIYYSLAAIKGVGITTARHIVEARADETFESLEDFCLRIDLKQLNRRVLEGLIFAGALDCFGYSRSQLFESIDNIQKYAQFIQKNHNDNNQVSIFSDVNSEKICFAKSAVKNCSTRFENERKVLGFYLSGHPIDVYKEVLDFLNKKNKKRTKNIEFAAIVISKTEKLSRNRYRIGSVDFSAKDCEYNAILFSNRSSKYKSYDEKLVIDDCYDHIIEYKLKEVDEGKSNLSTIEIKGLIKNRPCLLMPLKPYLINASIDFSSGYENNKSKWNKQITDDKDIGNKDDKDIGNNDEYDKNKIQLLYVRSLEKISMEILYCLDIRIKNINSITEIVEYFEDFKSKWNDSLGEINVIFVNSKENIEVDIKTYKKYPISPEIAFDLKHIEGVIEVVQKMKNNSNSS